MVRPVNKGFSLGEVLIALAIVAVTLLLIAALSISMLKSSRKTVDETESQFAVEQIFTSLNGQLKASPGLRNSFWTVGGANWRTGELQVGATAFTYQLDAAIVMDGSGVVLGAPTNRMQRVTLYLRWMSVKGRRAGYGKLETQHVRLIAEQ